MRRLAIGCVLLLSAAAVQAQADPTTPSPEGAQAAVETYLDAFSSADWERAGRLIDPAELEVMSDLVAFLAEMDTTEATQSLREETDNVIIFARFMELMADQQPMLEESLTSMQTTILGRVTEGDSLVHVVGRSTTQLFGSEVQAVEVTSVRWLGDRWALQLDAQLQGMTEGLKQFSEMMGEFDDEEVPLPPTPVLEEDWDDEDGSDG